MDRLAVTIRLLRIIYLALFASVPLYFLVSQLVLANPKPLGNIVLLRNVFWLFGATTAAVALVFRYRMMPAWPAAPPTEPELGRLLEPMRACSITSFALAESVALVGFVLRFLGGSLSDVLPFFAVSAVLFVLFFPRMPETYIG